MRLTVSPSKVTTDIEGVRVRLWTGTTDSGIPVTLAVRSVIVHKDEDCAQFERELIIMMPPLEWRAENDDLIERVLREAGDG